MALGDLDKIHLPVDVPRLIRAARERQSETRQFGAKVRGLTDLSPGYVLEQVRDLLNSRHPNGIKVY